MLNENSGSKYKLIKISSSGYNRGYLDGVANEIIWMQRLVQYYSFLKEYRVSIHCLRGEIYEFDFGININAEFSHRHYGIVLQDSLESNPLVIVCPLKTNKRGANINSDIDLGIIKELNTTTPTLAVFNQIRTIDKTRIYHKRIIGIQKTNNEEDNETLKNAEIEIPRLPFRYVDRILDAYWKMLDK